MGDQSAGAAKRCEKPPLRVFPYGLIARMPVCAVARWEETIQVNTHADSHLPRTDFDWAMIDTRSRS